MFLKNFIGQDLARSSIYTNHVGKKRYYSSVDAIIFFDGTQIDEITNIQWTEQQNIMPLFGYNSYVFDEMALGARLISGSFAINFIIPDYLSYVLKKLNSDDDVEYKNTGAKKLADQQAPKFNDIQSSGRVRPGAKSKGFDIAIAYGSGEDSITGKQPYIFLEDCFISSDGQAISPKSGSMMEIYNFTAKDKSFSR